MAGTPLSSPLAYMSAGREGETAVWNCHSGTEDTFHWDVERRPDYNYYQKITGAALGRTQTHNPFSRYICTLGNHESINMNQMYGFEDEVRSKYSSQMWDLFTELFNWLPHTHSQYVILYLRIIIIIIFIMFLFP